jgi:hypothetical protein
MDQLSYLQGLLWTQTVLVNCSCSNSQVVLVVKCKFVVLFFLVVLLLL